MEKSNMPSDWAGERVEAYVDGDLGREERAAFEAALARDPALGAEVERARAVKHALRAVATPPCPPEVTAAVFAHVRGSRAPGRGRLSQPLWNGPALRPAFALAVVVLAGLLVVLPWRSAPPEEPPAYADAQVQEALDEVRWTLAYLNGVGSRTGQAIRQEAFSEGVVRPIQYGLGLTDGPVRPHRQN